MSNEIPEDVVIKILLVDDEVNITKALRRLLLEFDHYDVYTASSGADALELIKEEPEIGVIISDQRMPEMTGVEFLSKARKELPDAIRILLTGYADIEASIGAINQGAVFRYLTKPWKDDELLQVVAEAARGFWLVAENKRLNTLVAKQNKELQDWNKRLKQRVLEQTSQILEKNTALVRSNKLLRNSFDGIIEALSSLIEMRDRGAPDHSRNVAELVTAMAGKLDLPVEERGKYRNASLLHDIGKIGMSDSLLAKPIKDFDKNELLEYQKHVVRGQTAIDSVPDLREIGILIRHHHERFDGMGFPEKLRGERIPLGARLICAADMFERLLSKYPESDALNSAIEEISQQWGKALDPALRIPLEEGAREICSFLDITSEFLELKVSPKDLEVGMQLLEDLHSGTGALMLKKGTVFDETAIEAMRRCYKIDPFEREISVVIRKNE